MADPFIFSSESWMLSKEELLMRRLHPDVLTMREWWSCVDEEEVEGGEMEMEVRVREEREEEKRELEREEDWMMNAMEENVTFTQYVIVNRTSLISLTPFSTLSELFPPSPSIKYSDIKFNTIPSPSGSCGDCEEDE